MFNENKCNVQGCNETRKKDGIFSSAYCIGHWYIRVVQPILREVKE